MSPWTPNGGLDGVPVLVEGGPPGGLGAIRKWLRKWLLSSQLRFHIYFWEATVWPNSSPGFPSDRDRQSEQAITFETLACCPFTNSLKPGVRSAVKHGALLVCGNGDTVTRSGGLLHNTCTQRVSSKGLQRWSTPGFSFTAPGPRRLNYELAVLEGSLLLKNSTSTLLF